MLKRFTPLLILLFILAAHGNAKAQNRYVVSFTDKNNNAYSLTRPEAYLSAKSIERRRLQHIAITESDLPLTTTYLQTITELADKIVYHLKWFNAVIVQSADVNFAIKALALPFVKSVAAISGNGPTTVQKKLDAPATKNVNPVPLDTNFYGTAANQNAMININALHQMGYWGNGVILSHMDAGYIGMLTDSFVAKVFNEGRILHTWNYVFDTSYVYAYDSHGGETFSDIAANIPGQMVGTAPNAKFLLFVTEDVRSEKIIEEYNWINAAEVADSLGAEVFSTSLGYTTFDSIDAMYNTTYASLNGDSAPMTKAANLAAAKGILVINSAGNNGATPWHYIAVPADGDSVVAVGAVYPNGLIGNFSSRGPNSAGLIKPNVCSQGVAAAVVLYNNAPGHSNGTSFSCPIMAGAFACLRQAFPAVPCRALINAVQQSGNYASSPNNDYGYGIPDFGFAYKLLKAQYPDDTLTLQAFAYPNPFNSNINVVISGLLNAPLTFDLYDLAGRKVSTSYYPIATYNLNTITFSPPAYLAAGSYILRINNSYDLKLIKQP